MAENGLLIGEMASLFGITVDTLRYYDKEDLLSPSRSTENGYRYYSSTEITKLISILFLRKIDVPMKEIRNRIDEYNLDDTLSLLKENKRLIDFKIDELKLLGKTIDKQIQIMDNYREGSSAIQIKKIQEPRSVIYIKKGLDQNQKIDEIEMIRHFICSESFKNIPDDWFLSGQIGIIYSEESEGSYDIAFFYDGNNKNADFILPPGKYASTMYKGTETSISRKHLVKLVDYIDTQGWAREKKIFEIWQIDEQYTLKEKDFVTEIQIYINKS